MKIIQYLPLAELKAWPQNARTHSRKQVKQLADSIRRFGFTHPVLIDEDNRILAGHGRIEAARALGLTEVPCLRLDHMSETEKRVYVIADNRLALDAGWDGKKLAQELEGLLAEDLHFDIGVTGFSIAETMRLIDVGDEPAARGDRRSAHRPAPLPARCRPGDVWRLGPHQLICGDGRESSVLAALLKDETVHMVVTDPARCGRIIARWEARTKSQAARIAGEAGKASVLAEAAA